eukprot:scaffold6.g2915.t1
MPLRRHGVRPRRLARCAAGFSLDPELLTSRDVPLSRLQALLDEAIEGEAYEAAAQLRDTIQQRRFDNRLAVEEANDKFYAAFASGSLPAMAEMWGKGEHVQCIHPGAGCIAGRAAVMEGWKLLLGTGRMRIKLQDVRVYASDTDGFVTCVEVLEAAESRGRIVATNVFEKQDGKWKITHHHGSPCPPPL